MHEEKSLSKREKMKNFMRTIGICSGDSSRNTEGPETKSGRLCLLQNHGGKVRKAPVFVRVYKSCFEQYAVLYRDHRYSIQTGYVNLKNCSVNIVDDRKTRFKVILNDFEGSGITFEAESGAEAVSWMDALQPHIASSSPPKSSISPSLSPVIPRSPLMPTLQEEGDEDE